MFWRTNNHQYDFDFEKYTPKIYQGIDTIKIKKKGKTQNQTKLKKHNFWSWFWFIILVPIIASFYFLGGQKISAKLNVFKFFDHGKYLILFQNNAEMRPTGGFIGSFAIVEFENYRLKNIDFNTNIYKLDKAFTADHVIVPPKPLAEISNNQWSLRDANFAVSFPEAAEKIEWFYNQETGESIDGVIALNATLVRDLIKQIGPITLDDYDTTINADNFFTELTQKIEKDYYRNAEGKIINEPKSILTAMMPQILTRLGKISKVQLGQIAYQALKNKEILFYSNNREIQQAIVEQNWGGKVPDFKGDYLYVNNANIADVNSNPKIGGKSSLNVFQDIDYQVEDQNGLLLSTLTITRSHSGSYEWPDGLNHNWSRILVPSGSILKSAELNGKDIFDKIQVSKEAGKTYFATWIDVAPNTSTVLNLYYSLPISKKDYQLLVQKQPGSFGDKLKIEYQNKVLFDNILNEDKLIK